MENLSTNSTSPNQSIWETNPKLKTLLLVLIFVFLVSGIGLVVLSQIGANYRQKAYEETENSLPRHSIKTKPVETVDQITGMVNFKDTLMGYEFKYPQKYNNYALSSDSAEGFDSDGYYWAAVSTKQSLNETDNYLASEDVFNFEIRKGKSIDAWIKEYKDFSTVVPKSLGKEKIAGIEMNVYTNEGLENLAKEDDINWYLWEKDGNLYIADCSQYLYSTVCYQILESFKYLSNKPVSLKTYTNEQYAFELQYEDSIGVGSKKQSINFGSNQNPVFGIDLAGGVLIPLDKAELKKQANSIFAQMKTYVDMPESEYPEGVPPPVCKMQNISNPNLKIEALYCVGEGGPAYYAYISGPRLDLFYDGYPAINLDINAVNKILSTFKFTK